MIDITSYTWAQWKAAGRHVASYSAGAVTAAVVFGLLTTQQASEITDSLQSIFSGIEQIAKGVTGLIATGTAIYMSLRAGHSANPAEQAKSITSLPAREVAQVAQQLDDQGARNKLINAVGAMPEVQAVVAAPPVALATPSAKVVSTPQDAAKLPPGDPNPTSKA